jgi:aminopeptidase-like protein
MSLSYDIIKNFYLTNRNFCSDDYDKTLQSFQALLPGSQILRYDEPEELKGWQIPPKWDLVKAIISCDGKTILDGTDHPLSVIGLSSQFSGEITGGELKKHLHWKTHFNEVNKQAIPFHFRQYYQPWNRDWGFCVNKAFYDKIGDGDTYYIDIQTRESKGYLDIIEHTLEGESDLSFVFVAHLDHPGMANDDLAGCAIGIELFKKLSKQQNRQYTYKLLIVQEIIGSVFYLENLKESERKKIKSGLFLEMLGSDGELNLQKSNSYNPLESSIKYKMHQELGASLHKQIYNFRELIGNDEIVFEAFDIPMSSLSRFPYKEYHTSEDNLSIISDEKLQHSLSFLLAVVKIIECKVFVERKDLGIYALSNPRYNLYVKFETGNSTGGQFRKLMDYLFFLDKPHAIEDLATMFKLPLKDVESYINRCVDHKIIKKS